MLLLLLDFYLILLLSQWIANLNSTGGGVADCNKRAEESQLHQMRKSCHIERQSHVVLIVRKRSVGDEG